MNIRDVNRVKAWHVALWFVHVSYYITGRCPKNIGRWQIIGPNTGLLDLWFGWIRVWENFSHTIHPLPVLVRDHVDAVCSWYVIYLVWRAACVRAPSCVAQILRDVNTAVFLSLRPVSKLLLSVILNGSDKFLWKTPVKIKPTWPTANPNEKHLTGPGGASINFP